MSENSKIEWTDHTFNPWSGCTKVSPGCLHCYAETLDKRHLREKVDHWGKGAPRLPSTEQNWRQPVRWNEQARRAKLIDGIAWLPDGTTEIVGQPESFRQSGRPALITPHYLSRKQAREFTRKEWNAGAPWRPRVFTASLADWLDDEVPVEWLARLLALIHATPHLDWLLLTKRPENWRMRMEAAWQESPVEVRDWLTAWENNLATPANVWIGTTVEDQVRADERLPALLAIPAKVRFLSCEPLLGPVDVAAGFPYERHVTGEAGIDWVIAGGESGPQARPMHPEWVRDLRDQCAGAGVPFFFKQWGEWVPTCAQYPQTDAEHDEAESCGNYGDIALEPDGSIPDGYQPISPRTWLMSRVGKKVAGRLLDGLEYSAFPINDRA